ncbi:MAG TPA: hypothetical protein VMM18_15265 [Gemmatimonadaceae bacterium]|nr:hypothetical protein [Gemmatimonadaceae bacterium]
MPTANSTARVLILSEQPLLAALVGMIIESGSLEAVFAEPGERAEDAITRIRPLLVILLDADMNASGSDLFFVKAARRGVPVLLFRAPGSAVDIEAIAEARQLRWISLPVDGARLVGVIAALSRDERSGTERRRRPNTTRAIDGTLIFEDSGGGRWYVFDRRGGERRGEDPAIPSGSDPTAYRAFVNEAGEEWRFSFPPGPIPAASALALERQLASAMRVSPDG